MTNLHYIIMAQKDVIKNQVLEEILRERGSYYNTKEQEQDFWILIDPSLLFEGKNYNKIMKTRFYSQQKSKIQYNSKTTNFSKDFMGAIVSSNMKFIEWLRLRLGYFEDSTSIANNSKASYVSDGVFGSINSKYFFSNLEKEKLQPYTIHPDLVHEQNLFTLEQYYQI